MLDFIFKKIQKKKKMFFISLSKYKVFDFWYNTATDSLTKNSKNETKNGSILFQKWFDVTLSMV